MNPTHSPQRAEAGIVIGGCELVRRIGRGGMAEVWVARRSLGKKGSKFVAIKLMADHYVGDDRYKRMFRAEAELAAVLSHANIVQVFDEGEEDGRSFLVMEWVDGLNLLKLGAVLALLGEEQRRFRLIAYIIGQLLHALHYAHSITAADGNPLGVVHRDVSPQNVLVSNHGEVKLTDFGVAYHAFEESSGVHVKGKVRYMAPEQLSGKTRSPTVDLYAVGALLHELLDGRRFRGEHEDGQDLLAAVLVGSVSPLSRPAPPELDRLRLALLEPNPARRVQTAEQAFALLERYPGYGDARHELTKLCGSLTGVVRPRAGLEISSPAAMAEEDGKTQWGGGKGRPRSKLHVAAEPVPSPSSSPAARALEQVSSRPPSPAPRVDTRRARPWASTPVTGRTVVGWPGPLLERIARAVPSASAVPSPSPQAAGGSSGGWVDATAPTWSGGGPSRLAPWTPSRPAAAKTGDTEVVEIGSGSETEVLLTTAPRADEITATQFGGAMGMRARERWARGALAGRWTVPVGLALGMVMATSSVVWLLDRGDTSSRAAAEREASEPLEAKTVEPLAAAASVRAKSRPTHANAGHGQRPSKATVEPAAPTEAPLHPTDRVRPAPPKSSRTAKPPPAKAVPKVLLKVRGSVGLTGAQVRVASRTLNVGDFRDVLVPAGRKTLKWRAHEHDAWQSAGSWRFVPGTTVMAFVSPEGLEVHTLP